MAFFLDLCGVRAWAGCFFGSGSVVDAYSRLAWVEWGWVFFVEGLGGGGSGDLRWDFLYFSVVFRITSSGSCHWGETPWACL